MGLHIEFDREVTSVWTGPKVPCSCVVQFTNADRERKVGDALCILCCCPLKMQVISLKEVWHWCLPMVCCLSLGACGDQRISSFPLGLASE